MINKTPTFFWGFLGKYESLKWIDTTSNKLSLLQEDSWNFHDSDVIEYVLMFDQEVCLWLCCLSIRDKNTVNILDNTQTISHSSRRLVSDTGWR